MTFNAHGLLVLLFWAVFSSLGFWMASGQASLMRSSWEVPAEIAAHDIVEHTSTDSDGDTSTTWEPVFRLRFLADGAPPAGRGRVGPMPMSASHGWAREKLAAYPVGRRVVVWMNPRKPDEAFLEMEASFVPYALLLFPVWILLVGLQVTFLEQKPTLAWTPPAKWTAIAIWQAAGVACALHFASLPGPFTTAAWIGIGIYGALGCGLALVPAKRS